VRTLAYMARRKITQAQADQIRERYEAIVTGTSDETIQDIQNDFDVSRTSLYALRDKGWNILAPPPRAGEPSRQETAVFVESLKALRTRVELLEDEVRALRHQVEG